MIFSHLGFYISLHTTWHQTMLKKLWILFIHTFETRTEKIILVGYKL